MINGLDLFTGIGGLTVALKDWVRPVAYCEIDSYAQGVLFSRMDDNVLPRAPIFPDIRRIEASDLPPKSIDIIYGGFPCQDVSVAGTRKGLSAERSGLFFEIMRLAEEIKPKFIFLENVPGIRSYLSDVAKELAELGYDCRWDIVSAQEVGAPHLRKRWFCLAYANSAKLRKQSRRRSGEIGKEKTVIGNDGGEESLANTTIERPQEPRPQRLSTQQARQFTDENWWKSEPDVGRVVNGLPYRVDRIKCLGNGVVPSQAKEAFERLIGLK